MSGVAQVYQLAMGLTVDSVEVPLMPGDTYEEFIADDSGEVDLDTALEAPSSAGAAAGDDDELC